MDPKSAHRFLLAILMGEQARDTPGRRTDISAGYQMESGKTPHIDSDIFSTCTLLCFTLGSLVQWRLVLTKVRRRRPTRIATDTAAKHLPVATVLRRAGGESASDIRTRLESVRRERERIERQARLLEEEEHLVRMLHDAERKEQEEKEEHKPGKDQSRHRELPRRQTRSLTGAKSVSTTAGVKRKADEANGFPTGNQADDMGYKVSAYPCQPCIDKDTGPTPRHALSHKLLCMWAEEDALRSVYG
ncbi:hypothetical protein CC1G_09924 [Coprinopsis cinerea okayama7|uniref:Uncharacterized protein n=1 Tax=Coprinopsis cinerea (strain Okayama-7 / 130 / ATCC MYA-4618 / FGSC 9003) TaxID=240176 RepID=A8NN14_COPC7|nr:hypothetical protein CC1G_09924 [Coprinopsis cinerea okayama7\|eukprot:XP_001835033.2 hypothetical protein CC1G_09924 [Coprinopsis cinerea okayama7\